MASELHFGLLLPIVKRFCVVLFCLLWFLLFILHSLLNALFDFGCLICCFTSTVNSRAHVGMVNNLNQTVPGQDFQR